MITQKPDILSVIKNEGYEINNNIILCPFHAEKYPSCRIYPEQNSFYCYGCNAGGDSITFIQKSKNLSFQEALKYLGINGRPYKPNLKEIKRKENIKKFREWCDSYHDDLCSLIRCLWKAKQSVKSIEQAKGLSKFYHLESIWQHQIQVLQSNNDEMKFQLYEEWLNEGI